MSDSLRTYLNLKIISPLSYFYAQFISNQSQQPMDSLLCYTAALVSQRNQQGDICINLNDYADKSAFESDAVIDGETFIFPNINTWINQLAAWPCVGNVGEQQPLIIDHQSLYLGKLWHFEHFIAQQITRLSEIKPNVDLPMLKNSLKLLFKSSSTQSIDWQKLAASMAVTQSFSVISGGPGTGKTTTLIKVLALLLEQEPELNIQLCAPTGKAAIRMLEAINGRKNDIGLDQLTIDKMPNMAKTIHRLLAYQQGVFRFNQQAKLNVDCLVIDEASMIDLELMFHLLSALPESCRLILLGDKDQLSSVDAGHVFSDICGRGQAIMFTKSFADELAQLNNIDIKDLDSADQAPNISNTIAVLKTSFRFTNDSEIGRLALCINKGQGENALNLLKQSQSELSLISISNDELPKPLIDIVLQHYEKVVEAKTVEQAIEAFAKFQLLCAVHKGPFGVDALNELISQRLYLRHKIDSVEQFNGQPILLTRNDYENNLFNGDVGVLWKKEQQYHAYFLQHDGGLKSYPLISLTHYATAWAMTVHKSQGSEYAAVVLLLPTKSTGSLNRELIYTGVTRAKTNFHLCCEPQVFINSCSQKTIRTSNLSNKLGWGF